MPRITKPLSPKEVDASREGDKLYDGGGLMLHHRKAGREWVLRYRFGDRRRDMPIGRYPSMSVKAARAERERLRHLIDKGIDPINQREADRAAALVRAENSFEAIATEWLAMKAAGWVATTLTKNTTLLEAYLFPQIGARPIAEILPREVLAALRKVESHAPYTATRLREMAGQVFRYGVQTGRCDRNPAGDLSGALKSAPVQHRPAIVERKEFAKFLQDLDAYAGCEPVTMAAVRFNLLTFVRPGEFRFAQWSEIDFEAREWKVPAQRMKVGKNLQAHTVPLAEQTIALLRELQPLTAGTPYLFPKAKGNGASAVISENSVNNIIEKLGYKGRQSSHGFRATARSLLSEQGWSVEAMERQLDHAERSKVVAAYARSQYLDERRRMMQSWADMVDALRDTRGNVAPIRTA